MTIAIIDRQLLYLYGLRQFLKEQFPDVRILEYERVDTIQKFTADQIPNLFILGIGRANETQHLDFISRVSKRHTIKTIVYDETADYARARLYLKAGANGYLSKQNDIDELTESIKQVLKGERFICGEVAGLVFNNSRPLGGYKSRLTNREYEVARHLIDGMKTSAIAKQLNRKASTISTIKNTIFRKLEVDNIMMLRDRITA